MLEGCTAGSGAVKCSKFAKRMLLVGGALCEGEAIKTVLATATAQYSRGERESELVCQLGGFPD